MRLLRVGRQMSNSSCTQQQRYADPYQQAGCREVKSTWCPGILADQEAAGCHRGDSRNAE